MHRVDSGAALERLLDGMHRAVLSGDLEALAPMGSEVEAMLGAMSPLSDQDLAERLRRKAERNAACLKAAARGVRAAQRRVAEIKTVKLGLVTYDGRGKRQEMPLGAAQLTQRV
ncbi:MAG: hypothetical protein WCC57_14180 [Paracoccaceae bacterium]